MASRKDAKIAKKQAKTGREVDENDVGRIIVDAAVMKDGITRTANGLAEGQ